MPTRRSNPDTLSYLRDLGTRAVSAFRAAASAPARSAVKAASSPQFSGWGGSGYGGSYSGPGAYFGADGLAGMVGLDGIDGACDPWLNSAVSACMGWICDNFMSPTLTVMHEEADGTEIPVPDHDALWFMESPNEDYGADALWQATNLSWDVAGVAYWIKSFSPNKKKLFIHYVPHWEITPTWSGDGRSFIDGYVHLVDGKSYTLGKDDVVRFCRGLDPRNQRYGLAPLDPVLRDIEIDDAANIYSRAVLRNLGVYGLILTPEDEGILPEGEAKLIKRQVAGHVGHKAGEALVLSMRMKLQQVAASPDKVALDVIRKIPEARICAAFKLPPTVVGLSVGNDQRSYANNESDNKKAFQNCLIPRQRSFARTLTLQLLPDLGGMPRESFAWDYSNVEALADDQDKLFARWGKAYNDGVASHEEARDKLKLGPASPGDTFIQPRGTSLALSEPPATPGGPPALVDETHPAPPQPAAIALHPAPQAALPAPAGKADDDAIETKDDPALEDALLILQEVKRRFYADVDASLPE